MFSRGNHVQMAKSTISQTRNKERGTRGERAGECWVGNSREVKLRKASPGCPFPSHNPAIALDVNHGNLPMRLISLRKFPRIGKISGFNRFGAPRLQRNYSFSIKSIVVFDGDRHLWNRFEPRSRSRRVFINCPLLFHPVFHEIFVI